MWNVELTRKASVWVRTPSLLECHFTECTKQLHEADCILWTKKLRPGLAVHFPEAIWLKSAWVVQPQPPSCSLKGNEDQ